ncbi:response regulator [Acinetobacter soli]|uniref:response regulator n=1 Tax=Acinetobacter soli TaxID=487316 RepID=UPI0012310DB7|nr:response regulator [Acinetobacter soli]WOQ37292.1 response regulator [Acinetobacter soli]
MLCKVSVVDDHALFRRGLVDILRQSGEYEIIAEYSSGKCFLENMQIDSYPELLLLDVHMPDESGLSILKKIRQIDQELKVVVLTACEDDDIILDAIQSGANGFLPKDTLPEMMIAHLREVLKGQTVLHGDGITLLARLLRQIPQHTQSPSQIQQHQKLEEQSQLLSDMTAREQETLLLIAKGLNNKLIARELGISDGTVKVYVKSLLRKLNLHSRLELSVWAHQHLKIPCL